MFSKHVSHVEIGTQAADGTTASNQFRVRRMRSDGRRIILLLEPDSMDQSDEMQVVRLALDSGVAMQMVQSVMLYGSRAALKLDELGASVAGPEPANSN